MTTRQEILGRIRKALALNDAHASVPENLTVWPELGPVLPPIPSCDLVPRFEKELSGVGGIVHRVRNRSEISKLLDTLLSDRSAGVVLSRNPLLASLDFEGILRELDVPRATWPESRDADAGPDTVLRYRERCFSAAAGITGVDFALAESGTLVLSSLTEGSQLASLSPPVHIAFYRLEQVVGSLEEILDRLRASPVGSGSAPGRSVVMITGTSRTADIEQILVRGVHGPRELHAVLVED